MLNNVKILYFSLRNPGSSTSANDFQENWEKELDVKTLKPVKLHQLPIDESEIVVVDTPSKFLDFLSYITRGVEIVGLDTEWKPSFQFNQSGLAVLQIATLKKVHIVDVMTLSSTAPLSSWKRFSNNFLGNPSIIKLGFAVQNDLVLLKQTLKKLVQKPVSRVGFIDMSVLKKKLQMMDFQFPFKPISSSESSESLNSLIEMCFGETLDKSDQFSNWEKRPLRRSQIIYAGTSVTLWNYLVLALI